MPDLISVDEFRERFDIDSEIVATRLTPHIDSASRRLRKWVGDVYYDQALDVDDTDDDLKSCLKNAEAHLAMHFAILGLNSPLSGKGVVATSMSSEGREMRKYLTPDETANIAGQFLELAREIAEPYIAADSSVDVEIVGLEDEDSGEAVTDG